jgi:hypothetical protein
MIRVGIRGDMRWMAYGIIVTATTNIEERCLLILLKNKSIMRNYGLLLIIAAALLSSCKKDPSVIKEGYFIVFYPREISSVYIIPGIQQFVDYQGITLINHLDFEGNVISQDNVFFSIQTSNHDIRLEFSQLDSTHIYSPYSPMPIHYFSSSDFSFLDTPNTYIEQQIKSDYDKDVRARSKGGDYNVMIRMEYRTTEIKGLTISTLNTPLFGKPAGASLNDFFTIAYYEPPVIVSAPTDRLVYGYSSKEYPASIDEWLNVSPLGQPNMYLVPNKKMEGLPLDVQFVVQMETADGLVMADTTRVLTITE